MSDGTFQKVSDSDEVFLYGPRKLLLCGFSAPAQAKMETFLQMIGLDDLPRVWAARQDESKTLGELMAGANDTGRGIDSDLPRTIVMAGITENQLHLLVDACRKAGMRQALFAALTPVSEAWPLSDLLAELGREREAMDRSTPAK